MLSPRTRRRHLPRFVLLGTSVAFGLLIAEFAIRLTHPQPVLIVSRGLYAPDPPRRYRLQPGFQGRITNRVEYDTVVSINQAGLRGPELEPEAPGTFRVLALGDSFTFGVGAGQEESYPALLQERLRARGISAQVLNAGAPGFGVPDAVAWYLRWGAALKPEAVVLAVFTGNDLQDAAPGVPKAVAVDGLLRIEGEKHRSLSRWLNYNSHFFLLLKSSSLGSAARRLLGLPEPLDDRQLRQEMELYSKERLPEEFQEGAAATEKAVADLVRSVAGTRILAVIVPSLAQVDPDFWDASLRRFGLDPARYDRHRPSGLFQEIFGRHGISILDLTEPFADSVERGGRIYFPIDHHLTPAGYRLMAEEVSAEILNERGER